MYDHGRNKYSRDNIREKHKETATAERRNIGRHLFTASAAVVDLSSGAHFSTRTTDLSAGGCFVDTLTPFDVGAKVRISVQREQSAFEALGMVVYSQVGLGMGIAFAELGAEQKATLDKWLSENSATYQPAPDAQSVDPPRRSAVGAERAVLARLVQMMISKGILSETEGTSLFNDSVLF